MRDYEHGYKRLLSIVRRDTEQRLEYLNNT